MFSAVRPGGVVVSPVASEEPRAALWRILFASWGVPLRTAEELAAEFSAAGFVDVEILDRDSRRPTTIRAIRP
jgi:hypothetical protein